MRALSEQRRQADQRIAAQNQQFAAQQRQEMQLAKDRRNQAIGMAFLDLGLDVARAASGEAIKDAFAEEDTFKGLQGPSLYKAAYQEFGPEPAPATESKGLLGNILDTQIPAAGTTPAPPADTTPAPPAGTTPAPAAGVAPKPAQTAAATMFPLSSAARPSFDRLLEVKRSRPTPLVPSGALPPVQQTTSDTMAEADKLLADADTRPLAGKKTQASRRRPVVKASPRQLPKDTGTAPTSPLRPEAKPTADPGELVAKRAPGSLKLSKRAKEVLAKTTGTGDIATRGSYFTGDATDLIKDPTKKALAAFDKIVTDARTEAEEMFPQLRELGDEEYQALPNYKKRAYVAGRAARDQLIDNYVKTQTEYQMARFRFADRNMPSDAQVLTSIKIAEDAKARHGFYTRTGLNNLMRRVASKEQFVILTSFREELAENPSPENRERLLNLIPSETQRRVVLRGGDATFDRDMTPTEINALITGLERFDKKAAKKARSLASRKGFDSNKGVFVTALDATTPVKYSNSHGQRFNVFDRKMLARINGPEVGNFLPNGFSKNVQDAIKDGRISAKKAAMLEAENGKGVQNTAMRLAGEIQGLQVRFRRARTKAQAQDIANIIDKKGKQLQGLLFDFNLTRLTTPKGEQKFREGQRAAAERGAQTALQRYNSAATTYSIQKKAFNDANAEIARLQKVPYETISPKNVLSQSDKKVRNQMLLADDDLKDRFGTNLRKAITNPKAIVKEAESLGITTDDLTALSTAKAVASRAAQEAANEAAAEVRDEKLEAAKNARQSALERGGAAFKTMQSLRPRITEEDQKALPKLPTPPVDPSGMPTKLTKAQRDGLRTITDQARQQVAGGASMEAASRALLRRARALNLPSEMIRQLEIGFMQRFPQSMA
tara:strand:+ start:9108 stop:11783 length:2676 start_codon:yes stop_codon:yes gene_type:complete